MVEQSTTENELFQIVGASYRIYEPPLRKPSLRRRFRGVPLLSISVLAVIVFSCVFAPLIASHDPAGFYFDALNETPNSEYCFGTDSLGRDIFSIMLYGGRASLLIGILGAAIIAVIGIVYGCISGTSCDRVDSVMMRITEFGGSIPTLLIILILSAIIPARNALTMSAVIGITGWFSLARIVRSEVRQIRNSEYVLYARCTSGKFLYVMRRHLIPNFLPAIMFVVVSNISTCITMESTLSFLGLGLPVDVLSWGSMLSLANRALIMNTWWVIIIPGVFLVVTLLCITNLANFLRKETNRRASNL